MNKVEHTVKATVTVTLLPLHNHCLSLLFGAGLARGPLHRLAHFINICRLCLQGIDKFSGCPDRW